MAKGAGKDGDFSRELEAHKRASTLQVLFKVARLLDERAVARVATKKGVPTLRRAHTSLLPHIALEGTRITTLAEKLGVTKQAVSQLVDELAALDVLARVPDPDDARAKRVVFTARGKRGFFEGLEVLAELERELKGWIGEARLKQLREALLLVHDRLDDT
ncbi:MAG: MarR family winged helix-turn-helix transcriptional regulator [Polyangiales bacterium]